MRNPRFPCGALLAALALPLPQAAAAGDGLENAYYLCDVFAKSGVSNECRASNVTYTVDVIMQGTAAEAADVCAVIVNRMVEKKRSFGGQWKLQIFAPGHAEEPLAACALR